jgi:hypothetical protein
MQIVENLKDRAQLGGRSLGVRMLLKYIVKKLGMRVWTEMIEFSTGFSGGILWTL